MRVSLIACAVNVCAVVMLLLLLPVWGQQMLRVAAGQRQVSEARQLAMATTQQQYSPSPRTYPAAACSARHVDAGQCVSLL